MTIEQKLSDLKISKTSLVYKSVILACEKIGFKTYVGANFGTGRYSSSKSWLSETILILKKLELDFDYGNDAPRGGKTGDYIIVNKLNF